MKKLKRWIAAALGAVLVLGAGLPAGAAAGEGGDSAVPAAPLPSASASVAPVPSVSAFVSAAPVPSVSASVSAAPVPSASAELSASVSAAPVPSASAELSASASAAPLPSASAEAEPSVSPSDPAQPGPYVFDDGGFPKKAEVFLAEKSVGAAAAMRLLKGGAELPADAYLATGQTLEYLDTAGSSVLRSQDVVVMGDVLGLGGATIGQVTRLAQAYKGTHPLEGIWLQAGDFDGSGSIDLTDLLQAAQELRDVQNTKGTRLSCSLVPMYLTLPSASMPVPMYFADERKDIPYLSMDTVEHLLKIMFMAEGWDETRVSLEMGDKEASFVQPGGTRASVDFSGRTIRFDDFNAFYRARYAATNLDLVVDGWLAEDGTERYLHRMENSFERKGRPVTVRLADYEIPALWRGKSGYLPLQTVSDVFMAPFTGSLLYNGQMAAFFFNGNLGELAEMYYSAPAGARSAELAAFSYNELCMALDMYYGLKEQHDIRSFDTLLHQTRLDAALLSEDAARSDSAIMSLTEGFLGDLHSGLISPSFYAGKSAHLAASAVAPSIANYLEKRNAVADARKSAYPSGVPAYEEIGDVAFVSLSSFTMDTQTDYYETPPGPDAADTIGIIGYAHSQITREGSPVKTVVLDISDNEGGAIDAAVYALSWLLGTAVIDTNDTLTGAQASTCYRADVNFDGAFDRSDSVASLNRVCLMSGATFSAGNTVCSVLKNSGVMLAGDHTSGGACAVLPLTTADGTVLQLSGPERISEAENGAYYDTDKGIAPDYQLKDPAQFYDRKTLSSFLGSLFA